MTPLKRDREGPVCTGRRNTWPRRGSGPGRERALIRMNGDAFLFSVALVGLLLGTWPPSGTLPGWLYYAFAATQTGILWRQARRGNLLCAAMGFCFTAMLLIGVSIPRMWRPYDLNGTYAGVFLTPSLIGLAKRVLLLTSSLYYVIVSASAPTSSWRWKAPDMAERSAARLGTRPLLLSGALLCFLTQHGELVTSVPYPSNARVNAGVLVSNSGLDLLSVFLIVFSLVAACRVGEGNCSRGGRLAGDGGRLEPECHSGAARTI
jgi:hypothetical protein